MIVCLIGAILGVLIILGLYYEPYVDVLDDGSIVLWYNKDDRGRRTFKYLKKNEN
jgi:uncharacterized membrane protein